LTKRVYTDYLKDIFDSINDIISFVENMSYDEFVSDKKTKYAVIRGFEIIGEATKHIPKKIKDKYPEIPWKQMAGMRDKVIHEYFGVNLDVLWKTATLRIPSIKPMIENIIKNFNGWLDL
jgi:uncharacterized protein with HEPN domain